jgi:CheY-like chemotaxis protein
MGGEMRLESTLGAGSRFTFTVRLGTTPAAAAECHQPELGGRRVLVVDANPISRAHVINQLRCRGADAIAAGDAVSARAIVGGLHATPVDALVVNPPLPHGERERFVAALRTVPGLAHVPCVALVTRLHVRGDPTFAEFAAVVPKPVKRATLVAALAKVLVQPAAAAS